MLLTKWKAHLAWGALVGVVALASNGCSSGGDNNGSPADGGGSDVSRPPQHRDGGATFDTGGGPPVDGGDDGGAPYDGTVGQPCMKDSDCSPTGLGLNKCTISTGDAGVILANFFTNGPIFPTPVCVSGCLPKADNLIHFCDGPDMATSPGICEPTASGQGLCLPKCLIPSDGSAPSGCPGKDVCNVVGWGLTTTNVPVAFGICIGGCAADADCPTGSKCQKDDGLCLTNAPARTKNLGDTCSSNDPAGTCNCRTGQTSAGLSSGVGYCTQFCITGPASAAPCPSGYACDTELPAQIINHTTDAAVTGFTMQNAGLAGSCFKTCGAGGGGDGGVPPAADAGGAGSDASGDAASGVGSDGGNDAGTQTGGTCPVTASCTTKDTVGPVCIP
jgi:hypothetical protein